MKSIACIYPGSNNCLEAKTQIKEMPPKMHNYGQT